MKKIIVVLLFLLFSINSSVFAFQKVNSNAMVKKIEFSENNKEIVYLKMEGDAELKNVAYLPKDAVLKAEVCFIQKEKRWHRNAYALLKIINFTPDASEEVIDLSEDDLYLVARKYVPVNVPDVAGTGIELGVTTAASFFLPGIDIAYYFTKGAIKKEKQKGWFKSGVEEAYDNSIFWFIQKGRTIELDEESEVYLKSITDKKINKILNNVEAGK